MTMSATTPAALRWTQRWLEQNGHGLQALDARTFELLRRRLAARRRALLAVGVAAVVAVGAVVWLATITIATRGDDGATPWSATAGWLLAAPVVAMVVGGALQSVVEARSDREIAATLPGRLARSERVRIAEVAGRRVVVSGAVTTVVAAVLTGVTWAAAPGWPAVTVTATTVLAALGAGARIWWALDRPTVACDPVTLTLDERIRRADVVQGAQLLVVSIIMVQLVRPFVLSPATPEALALAWFGVLPAVMVVQFVLTLPPRWPGPPFGYVPFTTAPAPYPPVVPR